MNPFFWGVIAMACWTAGLFFFRFWRQTRDRLFVLFALAFWLLCLNWVILGIALPSEETRHYVYLLRLAAFLLIVVAIVDKNRARKA